MARRRDKVTTDGHGSYPRAIRLTLGKRVTSEAPGQVGNDANHSPWA